MPVDAATLRAAIRAANNRDDVEKAMTGPGGERALPTFTDVEALRRWHPDAEHHIGLEPPDLFGKAIEWRFDVVLVNHADEDWVQLRDDLLATLADGRVPAL